MRCSRLAVQNIVEGFKSLYAKDQETELSLEEYLALAKQDPMAYASPAERMLAAIGEPELVDSRNDPRLRSEEHTSELQSLMRISYAVFCLKKKQIKNIYKN